jgi:hypothetical protein
MFDIRSLPPEFLKGLIDRAKAGGSSPESISMGAGMSDPLNTGFKIPQPGQMSQGLLGMDITKAPIK